MKKINIEDIYKNIVKTLRNFKNKSRRDGRRNDHATTQNQ